MEQCLFSVLKACHNIESEIFVVDNNSSDGSKEYLSEKFPSVIFKWQETNGGFSKANNSVLTYARGRYILFLNPDTIVAEDCFQKCLTFFHMNENAGAIGVHMVDGAGRFLRESKRSLPTPMSSFFKMAGFSHFFPSGKLFSTYYAGHLPETQTNEVDVLAGAFMMLSRHCLDKVQGFDEDYFMYGEDIDLSYRIQKAGLKNYYFAETSIIHFKGESTQRSSAGYVKTFYKAMNLFVAKHYKSDRATYNLMHVAINVSKLMSHAGTAVTKIFKAKRLLPRMMQVAIIGSQQRFEEMIRLMKYATKPLTFKGRIAPGHLGKGIHLGTEDNIPHLIKKFDLTEIVFCEGELSFKAIIEKTKQLNGQVNFLFHAQGSTSVVGSSKKNENGIFIAKH